MSTSSKPIKVTTVEQARSLPEVRSATWDFKRRILDVARPGIGKRGDMVEERIARPLSPQPIDGDQILLFIDADGRSMQVVYTPDGPAKTPFRL